MNRLKYITKYAENVLSGERLGTTNDYPKILIKGKLWLCHTLAFMTFFPDDWAAKKTDEFILHEEDSRTDFRPHKLRLGTRSDNGKDAHNNGKHDNTKSTRTRCISYVDDVLEKEHLSQGDAVEYLKSIGYIKAYVTNVGRAVTAFRDGKVIGATLTCPRLSIISISVFRINRKQCCRRHTNGLCHLTGICIWQRSVCVESHSVL